MTWLTDSAAGEVVSDTLKGAATGAIIGGATAAITGGKFSQGAKYGALGGALASGANSMFNNWDELTGNQQGVLDNQLQPDTTATIEAPNPTTGFSVSKDPNLADNDKYTLDMPKDQGGLLNTPIDTSLPTVDAGSDTSFINSLKNGFNNMTPAQSKFYGDILKGLGTGLLSMEQAKEAKKQADLKYEREKKKINPMIANSLYQSQKPLLGSFK